MSWLSEDPWFLAAVFGGAAVAALVALKVTQQGKYLIAALAALGLAGLVLVVEQFWVTEAERIEGVVRDLGRAVGRSDAPAALALLTPDVTLTQGRSTLPARTLLSSTIESTSFDFLSIRRLRTQAGRLTRRGTADFRVDAAGSYSTGFGQFNFATGGGSDWSLGLRQDDDGQWRIERITAVRLPPNFRIPGVDGGLP